MIVERRVIFIIGFFIISGASTLFAQKLSVETRIDTNIITIGDQINLNYTLEKKKEIITHLPVFTDTLTKGIEIIGDPLIDSSFTKDHLLRISVDLTISSFDTGIYYIPPQPIIFHDEDYADTLLSRATYLMVRGVPIDTTYAIRDIKGYEPMPLTIREVLIYSGSLLLLVAIVFFIFYYLRRRKEEKPLFKPLKPEEPPYITALRELDKLKAQKLWQQKQIKEYYTRITYIIRWYIEKRFLIQALEQTSEEILLHIKQLGIDDINYVNLESLLNLADLVKFAKGEPDPEQNILHLENAYEFIKKTKQVVSETAIMEENNN